MTDWSDSGRVVCPAHPAAISYAAAQPEREARPVLSRIIGIIVAVLIIVWIVSNPAAAGDTVHGWITGLITFFHHLAS
jgi:hypothetical protein